jgi:FAD/FMN-containing dehydrogenase
VVIHSTHAEPTLADAFSNTLETAFDEDQISDALIAQNIAQEKQFLTLREKLVLAQKLEGASIKHDISVPISRIAEFIEQANQAVQEIVPGARPYPFGHLGDGNIHYNISQPTDMDAALYKQKREAVHEAVLEIVHKLGGSFSAEHGVGILKTELIGRYKGATALHAMRSIKRALDPKNILNPGKVVGDIDRD